MYNVIYKDAIPEIKFCTKIIVYTHEIFYFKTQIRETLMINMFLT